MKSAIVLVALFVCGGGTAQARTEIEQMFDCYRGISWFSWQTPYRLAEAPAKQAGGAEVSSVLIPGPRSAHVKVGDGRSGQIKQNGIYLITEDEGYFFPFTTVLNPETPHDFVVEFESGGYKRRLWIRHTSGASPSMEVLSTWPHDLNYLTLHGIELEETEEREAVLGVEVARFVGAMRSTYDKQVVLHNPENELAHLALLDSFLARLKTCSLVKHRDVTEAVSSQQAEFRKVIPASYPKSARSEEN